METAITQFIAVVQHHFITADVLTPAFQIPIASYNAAANVAHNIFSFLTWVSGKSGAKGNTLHHYDTQNSFEYLKLPHAQYQNHVPQCLFITSEFNKLTLHDNENTYLSS